jgi:protein-S-isoprenylcysteine O-methyltransferase Ste14
VAGWVCAATSFAIRRQAIAALGRFWSLHVEIRKDHELVKDGPFRWVRHPTYLSMVLELLAGGLILNAWYSLIGVSLLFVPTLLVRIQIEEAALVAKFGDAYQNYQRSTPALFPYKTPCPR